MVKKITVTDTHAICGSMRYRKIGGKRWVLHAQFTTKPAADRELTDAIKVYGKAHMIKNVSGYGIWVPAF